MNRFYSLKTVPSVLMTALCMTLLIGCVQGAGWNTVTSPTTERLFSISMISGINGWAVGTNGIILRYNGVNWNTVTSPTTERLFSVDMVSASDGWAVGDPGTIIHWNGANWNTVTSPGGQLFCVDMVSATDGWAVGMGGIILRWNGYSWNTVASPTTNALYGVNMVSATDGWAVGYDGTIIRWNGVNWNIVPGPSTDFWHSVDMVSASDGWAVSYTGTIMRWNGASWNIVTRPTTNYLYSVSMQSSTDGWAVGGSGTLVHWNGISWDIVASPNNANLLDVFMVDSIDVWAVGYDGTIIYWDGPDLPPAVSFSFVPTSPKVGDSVSFDASSSSDSDGYIVSYAWTFGDGSTGSGENPSHSYSSAGTKTVTLTVTDNDGLTNSQTKSVVIEPDQVATPILSPAGGTFGGSALSVSISCDTDDVTIRYTTNGADPTSSSTVYSNPISVSSVGTVTIKARAFRSGWTDSDVASGTYTIRDKVATPILSPAGGTYGSAQSVSVSCATSGATIRYTTDGSTPTSSSSVYSGSIPVSSGSVTIRARAFRSGWTDSDVASGTYTIEPTSVDKVATPILSPAGGTYGSAQSVSVSCATSGATIRYTTDGSTPTSSSSVYSGSIPVSSGSVTIRARAFRSGWTDSDVASGTYTIEPTSVDKVATPILSPAGGTYGSAQSVSVSCATSGATIRYTTDGSTPTSSSSVYSGSIPVSSGSVTIRARAFRSGWTDSDVASGTYTIEPTSVDKVATPILSPAGGTYGSAQSVSVSCATSGATIRYTTDGSTPTSSSSVYSGSIPVSSGSVTIRARAFRSGWTDSDVASGTYTIEPTSVDKVATPILSPAGGTYGSAQSVSVSCATSGATIRYTTDGSTPTSSSSVYSGSIPVSSGSVTIRARAFRSGWTDSDVASGTYTIEPSNPEEPFASFTFSPSVSKVGETVNFDASGSTDTDGTIVNYAWDFGDGIIGTGLTTIHSFTSDGNYRVTLTVTDNDGYAREYTKDLTIFKKDDAQNLTSLWILIPVIGGIAGISSAFLYLKRRKPKEKVPKPTKIRITVDPNELLADGKSKSTVVIELLDSNGNPVSALNDTEIKLDSTMGRIEKPLTKIPKGTEKGQSVLVSSKKAGSVTLSADAKGLKSTSITVNFMEKKRYCMHCGTKMPLTSKRCPECGKSPPAGVDTKECKNCKAVIPAVANFCAECGASQPKE